MPITKYNKLVRDRIPEIIRENGGMPATRELSQGEYLEALASKLSEEVAEIQNATDRGELMKEIGDTQEVLNALIYAHRFDPAAVEKLRVERLEKRGGFEKRIFLESVETAARAGLTRQ